MHTSAFIDVYSGEQVWPMGLLFLKTSPVKQYSYENDFSGVFDALHQSFLVTFTVSALWQCALYKMKAGSFPSR